MHFQIDFTRSWHSVADRNCSKRPMENANSNMHSLTGFPHWKNLPRDLQRSVLASRALSLRDLAKLAPLGKVFKEVYLERCAEEEQWLEHAAVSVLGAQAVDTLVCWLSCPTRSPTSSYNPILWQFKLSEGEPWPDLRPLPPYRFAQLQQPARFLPGDLQNLCWEFSTWHHVCPRSMALRVESGLASWNTILLISVSERELNCYPSPRVAAQALPCLGVVYLACKKAAESLGSWHDPALRQGFSSGYVRVRRRSGERPCLTSDLPFNDVPGVPPDVQRAFSAINMRIWNFGRCKFGVSLSWQGWD
eukprot:jgi/Botrbrau1/2338/Bobra.39_1s0027.1